MSRTYYGANGDCIDINVTGSLFLDKLTFGMWKKIGIPCPVSESDTKIIARLLRNYASLQRETLGENHDYAWRLMGYEQDDLETIKWTEETAKFFEHSDGLVDEEDNKVYSWYPGI